MPVFVDYPPPPDIDFSITDNAIQAELEMNSMLDACAACVPSEAAVRAAIQAQNWTLIFSAGPASEVFRSPSNLKLSLSIRQRANSISVQVGSQDKRD